MEGADVAKEPSSFFSERTAEYFLVPVLQRALAAHFGSAIPIFFWKTREGNRTSLQVHEGRRVRIVAMFARRPKVGGDTAKVMGRISYDLWAFSRHAEGAGVMTIAALPVVGSIHELYGSDARVLWLPLNQNAKEEPFSVDKHQPCAAPITAAGDTLQISTIEELVHDIDAKGREYQWSAAMQLLGRLRDEGAETGGFFGRFGGYRPVYFILPVDRDSTPSHISNRV